MRPCHGKSAVKVETVFGGFLGWCRVGIPRSIEVVSTRARVAPRIVCAPGLSSDRGSLAMWRVLIGLVAIVIAGCARPTNITLVPTGGSRADGTVTLSYEYGGNEKPIIDAAQGAAAARDRCKAWGYSDAQPFGGESRQCQAPSQYGCMRWFVSVPYQCLGGSRPS